jgi:hypothetical protein
MGEDEYPPEGRFGWDMIELTTSEIDALVDYADAGMFEEAEAVVDKAEARMFGITS